MNIDLSEVLLAIVLIFAVHSCSRVSSVQKCLKETKSAECMK